MAKLKICFFCVSLFAGIAFISLSCVDTPLSPKNDKPVINIVLGDLQAASADSWLAKVMKREHALPNKFAARKNKLSRQTAVDEVKILVLDLSQWESEEAFRRAWGDSSLVDSTNWNDELDDWDNVVAILQSYTGDKFRFAGEFSLEIDGTSAKGTISASPGLNYFLIGLREAQVTRLMSEKFFVVNEEENTLCFGCGAPGVAITSPAEGSVFTTNVTTISGTISDDTLSTATLIIDEFRQTIAVNDSAFSIPVVLSVGMNSIVVQASNAEGTRSDTLRVEFQGLPASMRATLTWNTNNTDMDLLMVNPNNVTCSLTRRDTGGMTFDVDVTSGFGPENISVNQPITGDYTVQVRNFSNEAGLGTIVTVHLFREESLIAVVHDTITAANVNRIFDIASISWPGGN